MRSVRGWQPARPAAMLMTYTGRRALATRISKDLSMPLSTLLLFRDRKAGERVGARLARRGPPRDGAPAGGRGVHRRVKRVSAGRRAPPIIGGPCGLALISALQTHPSL